ncbi:hypothetical protein, partial [Roseovarius sp.]|uniref:hypothetical protein n=1 Tax=Roseovarius sp. TaxID=1486281 RepID=UPI0035682EF8
PKNNCVSDGCKLFTKSAQSSGPENIGPQRPLPGLTVSGSVLSPARITLENNGKIRPQPDGENAFARASGGADHSRAQLSPVQVSTARDRFEILRAIEGQ